MVLLGVGVRTVSFLRVKVYAAGFYIEQDALGVVSGSSVSAPRLNIEPLILVRVMASNQIPR
jgi:hypothetical protein